MEAAQIVLIVVVIALTVLLGIIGVQLFLILREARESLRKIDSILVEIGRVVQLVRQPAVAISESLSQAARVLGVISRFLGGKKDV
jgi:hypothetical protein